MAVSSWRMRKDVMCEIGAFPSARVYLWRKLGSRRSKRSMRDWAVGVDLTSDAYGRVCGLQNCGGRGRTRRSVVRNILNYSSPPRQPFFTLLALAALSNCNFVAP